ncbi:hypothetical protein M409DRAFT_20929 [Zasmidium cellare ATCC 36951]|uniref:Xylanolytic transcriptional activator regulatory domain-containing protein n=1 Tax=Zasmidium cellare ATCC 36951 TaxID=1080233 RepID=A0A6A6CNR1_ZASCE|nr:uncharacterized protein M409DRAFT_20929 [Zasmidium cellare ATCC 36951]KAF2168917.1 hypothetical protein M409DRAFT_20929 [Zasmidium cellare ATCC 36951]
MNTDSRGAKSGAVARKKRVKIAVACIPCRSRKDAVHVRDAHVIAMEWVGTNAPIRLQTGPSGTLTIADPFFVDSGPTVDQAHALDPIVQSTLLTQEETTPTASGSTPTSPHSSCELMQQLREILEPDAESLPQRIYPQSNTIDCSDYGRVLPMRSVADRLVRAYWDGIHPYYPFLHRSTFESQYQTLWMSSNDSNSPPPTFYSLLNVVFAVAAHLELPLRCNDKGSASYFERARANFHFDPCEPSSLLEIQILLLMGLYQIASGEFSRAKRVLDIAICSVRSVRTSFETRDGWGSKAQEQQIFRCVWHGSHLLSRVVSSALGQFPQVLALASTVTEVPFPTFGCDEEALGLRQEPHQVSDQQYHPSQFYSHTLRLNKLLGEIYAMWNETGSSVHLQRSDQHSNRDLSKVLAFDKRLVEYWKSLPRALHHGHEDVEWARTVDRNQSCILRTRYLFCRIALLRPLLPELEQQLDNVDESDSAVEEVLLQRLILRCVSSAKELLDLMDRLQGVQQSSSFGVPLLDYCNVCFVYTAATVISEARKALLSQRSLAKEHLTTRGTRDCTALQGLWQSRAAQDNSSFEATPNAEQTQDDFAMITTRNDGGISQDALGDLDDFMFVGPELAFGDSLEWFQGAMT